MKYIILFLNIRNWEIKSRFRSIDTVARCQTKITGACMYHWTSCTQKKLCMDWNFIHIMLCYSHMCRCMWSISDKHLAEETMMIVWEQNNYLKAPIKWFRDEVDLGATSRLVTRLESPFESACCENRAPLVVGSFSNDMSVTSLIDCNPSMLNHISCQKWVCFLNDAITKNRTITKPSCQVRRLSKLKPAPIIYLYLFVCWSTKRVPSFVEAWLCYAHGCTFLALLFMPSPNPLAWH